LQPYRDIRRAASLLVRRVRRASPISRHRLFALQRRASECMSANAATSSPRLANLSPRSSRPSRPSRPSPAMSPCVVAHAPCSVSRERRCRCACNGAKRAPKRRLDAADMRRRANRVLIVSVCTSLMIAAAAMQHLCEARHHGGDGPAAHRTGGVAGPQKGSCKPTSNQTKVSKRGRQMA